MHKCVCLTEQKQISRHKAIRSPPHTHFPPDARYLTVAPAAERIVTISEGKLLCVLPTGIGQISARPAIDARTQQVEHLVDSMYRCICTEYLCMQHSRNCCRSTAMAAVARSEQCSPREHEVANPRGHRSDLHRCNPLHVLRQRHERRALAGVGLKDSEQPWSNSAHLDIFHGTTVS